MFRSTLLSALCVAGGPYVIDLPEAGIRRSSHMMKDSNSDQDAGVNPGWLEKPGPGK